MKYYENKEAVEKKRNEFHSFFLVVAYIILRTLKVIKYSKIYNKIEIKLFKALHIQRSKWLLFV